MNSGSYVNRVIDLLQKWPILEIEKVVEELILTIESKKRLFLIGNGGSAATASHMATDLGVGSLKWSTPANVIALVDNSAVLTATANDYGYQEVFSRQLKVLATQGDVILAISASGNSQNLISAVRTAKEIGCKSIGVTAFGGGTLREIVDFSIHIETQDNEYGPAEDIHSMIGHCITELIRLKSTRK